MVPLPNFKGFDFFPHGTRIDFMRFRDICFWGSIAGMVLFAEPATMLRIGGILLIVAGIGFLAYGLITKRKNRSVPS